MKIRSGFVSNSSSTSFVFIWKTNHIEDLMQILHDRFACRFDLMYSDWFSSKKKYINFNDVKNKILSLDEYRITPIEEYQEYLEETQKHFIKDVSDSYIMEKMLEDSEKISRLKSMKEEGFSWVFEIGFGDNHGDVYDCDVGFVMDYEGRNIDINSDDVIVWTEQNR